MSRPERVRTATRYASRYRYYKICNIKKMPLQTYTYNRVKYFVDYRVQQFRSDTPVIRFYDFRSDEGDRILYKMIREGAAELSLLRL